MLGAIAGDVIGSVHEWAKTKTKDFPLFVRHSNFTDDSVLTVAVADWIMTGNDLVDLFHEYVRWYPGRGYGSMFCRWAETRSRQPYNSYGNGSAMRVSPVGFAFGTIEEVLDHASRSASVTHDHSEGIRGAQATAAAVFHARTYRDKGKLRDFITSQFGYDLSRSLDEIRPGYHFNETCYGTVPQAVIAFLESTSYEDAIRNAISLGGDADTLACITGGIAEAYYGGLPRDISDRVMGLLDDRIAAVVEKFRGQYSLP
jgi:ADP-ribosylglycohydrolase